MMFSVDEWKNK